MMMDRGITVVKTEEWEMFLNWKGEMFGHRNVDRDVNMFIHRDVLDYGNFFYNWFDNWDFMVVMIFMVSFNN